MFYKTLLQKEGQGMPAPSTGRARYLFLLKTHFWKLISLNLLFVLFSIPIVTLPASITALNRVCFKLVREGNCFLFSDFWDEWKQSLWNGMLMGLFFFIILSGSLYLVFFGLWNLGLMFSLLFLIGGALMSFLFLKWGIWTFALLSILDLKPIVVVKNAWFMALGVRGIGTAVTWMTLLLIGLVVLLFPFGVPVMLLLLFSFLSYTTCFLLNKPIEEKIVRPFNDQSTEET